MDIRKIKTLIEMLEESSLNEIEVCQGEESVRISKGQNRSHSNENTNPSFFSGIIQWISKHKIQNDYEDCSLIDNTYISQDSDSNVKVHTFSLGGKLIRNNLSH